jgi:hypothetical protein
MMQYRRMVFARMALRKAPTSILVLSILCRNEKINCEVIALDVLYCYVKKFDFCKTFEGLCFSFSTIETIRHNLNTQMKCLSNIIFCNINSYFLLFIVEHKASVNCFISLHFSMLYMDSRTPWTRINPFQGVCLYRTIQIWHEDIQISMPWVGFEPMTPASERRKTVDDLDHIVAVISKNLHRNC